MRSGQIRAFVVQVLKKDVVNGLHASRGLLPTATMHSFVWSWFTFTGLPQPLGHLTSAQIARTQSEST
jgi:hypothetical protein